MNRSFFGIKKIGPYAEADRCENAAVKKTLEPEKE